jgi:hypothetical protein
MKGGCDITTMWSHQSYRSGLGGLLARWAGSSCRLARAGYLLDR